MKDYFLVKSEPDNDYSIQDLQKDGKTLWDGVHNYEAINAIKSMKIGDQVLMYHSGNQKAIVGLAEVVDEPFENKKDSRFSWVVTIKFIKTFDEFITLSDIKSVEELKDFKLVTHSRLSVIPLRKEHVAWFKKQLPL